MYEEMDPPLVWIPKLENLLEMEVSTPLIPPDRC
jgi:hypothetical protein